MAHLKIELYNDNGEVVRSEQYNEEFLTLDEWYDYTLYHLDKFYDKLHELDEEHLDDSWFGKRIV